MALEILPPSSVSFSDASPETFSGLLDILVTPFGKNLKEPSNVIQQASQGLDSYSPAVDSDLKDPLFTGYGTLVRETEAR